MPSQSWITWKSWESSCTLYSKVITSFLIAFSLTVSQIRVGYCITIIMTIVGLNIFWHDNWLPLILGILVLRLLLQVRVVPGKDHQVVME